MTDQISDKQKTTGKDIRQEISADPLDIELERVRLERERMEIELERSNKEFDLQPSGQDDSAEGNDVSVLLKTAGWMCAISAVTGAVVGFLVGIDIGLKKRPPPAQIEISREFIESVAPYALPEKTTDKPARITPSASDDAHSKPALIVN